VSTSIASGNVAFESSARSTKRLEKRIEKQLREALGYDVAVFVRTETELARIAKYHAFAVPQLDAATELNIVFLAEAKSDEVKHEDGQVPSSRERDL
jgi:uncharacterized protein (DUF1697 family)